MMLSLTLNILPLKKLSEIAHKNGALFFVDGAQGAGIIKLDMKSMGIDCLCVPGHKGLLGPMGTGALLHKNLQFSPIVQGGTGTSSFDYSQPREYPERLEAGTLNVGGIAGLSAALDEFELSEREYAVYDYLVSSMSEMVDITLHGVSRTANKGGRVPVLLFNKKGSDCESVADRLSELGVAVRAGFHCAPNAHKTLGTYETGGVRISLSKYNTQREAELFLDILRTI